MTKAIQTPPIPERPDATTAFVHWQRTALGQDATAAGLAGSGYGLVWQAWVQQLQGPPAKAWHDASAEDVARFLQIRPGQRAHHQPERQISEVTRRRYWRLLDRLYDHAVGQGWVTSNPVQAVHPFERPAPEQPTGHVLPTALWQALPRYFPGSDDLPSARDQAVLSLLYELALAPQEVRLLTLGSLRNAQQAVAGPGEPPCFVQISGERVAQQRTLALPPRSQRALAAWHNQRLRSGTPADAQAPLFESRKGGPLSIRALFHIVSKTIALAQQAGTAQSMPLARMGPQVLRNTAIVQWLHAGVPASEVVQRIGVDQVRALAHLQPCLTALQSLRRS